ncbi:single-stranded DNA-binding protein 1 [Streptomyces pristinaespiralis ATCC 25486]|uniref:Single-stranded DNA-binding protein n=1 Tax=Streptomyces pristinaespiralis (strain ATCC 25486 / DSM 40338 / CBS 914.69 / JCM 4507 / KCC S-0507 / NBRC 13074 / NRRL 2958 / 5647) TaxID=457429 RepID=B5H606_STRE2|nr:single-stranded DNA-binding protein 1 [Streptomyces pristinaespiralis ATCC 25486]
MAGETVITVVGNLVDDPELRFTPSGAAVAKFRVASTPRTFDRQTNEWKDGESLFLTCSVWRQAAENVAESLQRGMRVVVQGRLKQRSYEDREGVKRTVYELDVEEVGPSLKNATAKVTKTTGRGGQGRLRRRCRRPAGRRQLGRRPRRWSAAGWRRCSRRRPLGDRCAVRRRSAGRGRLGRKLRRLRGLWRRLLGRAALLGQLVPHFLITQEIHHGEAACAQA